MTTLHASSVQWSPTSRYFRADAGVAISRKNVIDVKLVYKHVES